MSKLEELIKELCPNGVEYKKISIVANMARGVRVVRSQLKDDGQFPVYQNSMTPLGYYDRSNCGKNTTFIISAGAAGEIGYSTKPFWAADDCWYFVCQNDLNSRFLYFVLQSQQQYIFSNVRKASVPRLVRSVIDKMQIPMPPIEVQREIVRILDNFTELTAELTAELVARHKQYEYYRDKILTFTQNNKNGECDVQWLRLGDVLLSINTGLNPRQFFKLNTEDATNYYVTIREIQDHRVVFSDKTDRINDAALRLCNNRSNLEVGDILFSGTGTIGETALVSEAPYNWNIKEGVYSLKPNSSILLSKFLMYLLDSTPMRISFLKKAAGGTVKSVPMVEMRKLLIPIPPLAEQERIVAILDCLDKLCNDISEGLPAEIEARKKQYEYYRDKLLTFKHYSG